LTNLYFVRHGQAGTRHDYDSLSPLGRTQARLLGEFFAAQRVEFAAAYSGTQSRQQQTAAEVASAILAAGAPFPPVAADPSWNEFDLDAIYREMAPPLCHDDPAFAAEYEKMRAQLHASADSPDADIHRRWSPCDVQMVDAWIRARYPFTGESWDAFRARIAACRPALPSNANANAEPRSGQNVIIFTSATPTAIWTGLALGITDARLMWLAGALHNASFSMLKQRREGLTLFSFNNVPHLPAAELRTHR
jgi:broad specificity phosphatase PhoE